MKLSGKNKLKKKISRKVPKKIQKKVKSKADKNMLYKTNNGPDLIRIKDLPFALHYTDTGGKIIEINRLWSDLLGYSEKEAEGREIFEFLVPESQDKEWKEFNDLINNRLPGGVKKERRFVSKSNEILYIETRDKIIRNNMNIPVGVLTLLVDVTDYILMADDLRNERDLLKSLINRIPNYIFIKDREGRFIYNNHAHIKSMGLETPDQAVEKTDFDFFPKELAGQYFDDERKIIETGKPIIDHEESYREPDGTTIWHTTTKVPFFDKQGKKIMGIVGMSLDITRRKQLEDELRKINARLEELILTDSLPNARNRRFLENDFSIIYNTFIRADSPLSMIMCDIDNFSQVNNRYGHDAGDDVLRKICSVTMDILKRKGDLLIRYGGEEFLIVLFNMDITKAKKFAKEMLREISDINIPAKPGEIVKLTWSMGIAQADKKEDFESLIKRADEALLKAKRKGKNRIELSVGKS